MDRCASELIKPYISLLIPLLEIFHPSKTNNFMAFNDKKLKPNNFKHESRNEYENNLALKQFDMVCDRLSNVINILLEIVCFSEGTLQLKRRIDKKTL